jgi:O-antigen/teichoic acid export membrane protein
LFGELNWALAILLILFSLLSLGLDQIVIKKVAAGEDLSRLMSLYFIHLFISGTLIYILLFVCISVLGLSALRYHLLLSLGIGKCLLYFSSVYKQVATGMEKFRPLLFMNTCSNLIRTAVLLFLLLSNC